MPDVVMPRLSDSMEEGTILRWLKHSGEALRRGEGLVEIETDKATVTHEAPSDGLLEILVSEGETVPIGAVIARIGGRVIEGTEDAAAASRAHAAGANQDVAPVADTVTGTSALSSPRGSPQPTPSRSEPRGDRIKVSPVARRIARERGLDLNLLVGSGPGGRIVLADLDGPDSLPAEAPTPGRAQTPVAASSRPSIEPSASTGQITTRELTNSQRVIAARMVSGQQTVPEFTLESRIDMERAAELRERLHSLRDRSEPPPTYNDMIVRACALALRESPSVNGAYKDGRFELHSRVNVGIAVATADSLVVPTIFDADQKGLQQIAAESRRLAERVRDATVTPRELSGGTFTVSNLGMFGIDRFTAIINAPQAAILAVGAITPQPVARGPEVVVRRAMSVTLTCDHRILYGADAARFLARIRELLDEPLALLD